MKSDRAFAIAAPFVAAALVLLATAKRGPALSPDSAVYLSVADHLAQGRGWVQFDDAPYVRWAPLYPWVLSLGPRVGIAAVTVARVLQPLAFAGCVALCGTWLGRHVRGFGWRAAALALVTLSTIGIESAAFVWSESLDLLFTLGCLVALDSWMAHGRDRAFAAAMVCVALACLTRYASLVLVPVGVVAMLAAPRSMPLRGRVGSALGFAASGLTWCGLWMARNVSLGAGPLGAAGAAGGFSWPRLAAQAGNAASHWVSPESSPPAVRVAALALFALLVVATLAVGFARAGRERSGWLPPALLVAFMGAHKLAVLAGAHTVAVEGIEERYLAPLFAPLVLTLAWAADRACSAPARPLVARGLAGLAGLWIAFTALRTADRERGYLGDGAWGLNNARWERSELLAASRWTAPRGLVYSNAPDALYALAHVEARLWPRRHVYNAPGVPVDDLARYTAASDSAGGCTLIWFFAVDREYLLSPKEVGNRRGVMNTGRLFDDGSYIEAWTRRPPAGYRSRVSSFPGTWPRPGRWPRRSNY